MADKEPEIIPNNKEETIVEENPVQEEAQLINIDLTEGSERYPDVYFDLAPDHVKAVEQEQQSFIFRCENQIAMRISVLAADMIRVRYSLTGEFAEDFSYAIDPKFSAQEVPLNFSEEDQLYRIQTPQLQCTISKRRLLVHFYDVEGQPVCQEKEGFIGQKTILKGITSLSISKAAPLGEHYFGLGDKSCTSNLRGHHLENWNTDAFAFNDSTDPLYRAIPFYYGLYQNRAYGIFMDNSYRSHFDFDSEKNGATSFSTAGGEMNYYFIYGPELLQVASRYTKLTGRPDLPPIWALGFHQCRWSYYPEERVRAVCSEFRKLEIPCDAIYLDIDYMEEYRCFTWNKKHFPAPKTMITDLKKQGFKTVVMIDPGIKVDPAYSVYREGKEQDLYCKRPDGELMTGPVWPPDCVFPDFTKPATRAWWGPLYRELYVDQEISGFWNDMNEPAVFKVNKKTFPEDVRHDYDGHPCSHAKAHNIYGLQMSRATQEGLAELKPAQRPFVITRATFAGGQRYASAWTGDNVASWEHLELANIQCQRMSVSGFSFIGTDIGGFVDQPTGELFVRWLQLGIFHPLYRVHSMGNNADGATEVDEESVKKSEAELRMDQEPWSFGKAYTALAKEAIELRYRLLPYLYTAFWQYSTLGIPMLKSLAFVDQNNPEALGREKEFLFGDHLLAAPVTQAGQEQQEVYLPNGKWLDYRTAECYAGCQLVTVKTPLSHSPIFVRAGAVIPHYPIMQYTGERPVENLELEVYYGTEVVESILYEDAGDGMAHHQEAYTLRKFKTEGSTNRFSLRVEKTGKQKDSYKSCTIRIHGLPFKPVKCQAGDGSIEFTISKLSNVPIYVLNLESEFTEFELISG